MSDSTSSSDGSWVDVDSEMVNLQPVKQEKALPAFCSFLPQFCLDMCFGRLDDTQSKVSHDDLQLEKTAVIDQVDACKAAAQSTEERDANVKLRYLGPEYGLGRLHFKLMYDANMQILYISVIKAAQLRSCDTSGKSDPYVIIKLSPDCEGITFKTSKIRDTLKPSWNEHFQVFNITNAHLKSLRVIFTVNDWDKFGSHDNIGELNFPLKCLYKKETKMRENVDEVDNCSGLEFSQFQDLIDRVKIAATREEIRQNRKVGKKKSTEKSSLMTKISAANSRKKSQPFEKDNDSVISLPISHHTEYFLSEKVLHDLDNIDSISDIVPYKKYEMPNIKETLSRAPLQTIHDMVEVDDDDVEEKYLQKLARSSRRSDCVENESQPLTLSSSKVARKKDEVDNADVNVSSSVLPAGEAAGDTKSEYLSNGTATESSTPSFSFNNPLETISALMPRVKTSKIDEQNADNDEDDIRTIDVWRNLHPLSSSQQFGQILITLCYYPHQCSLVTTVIKAQNVFKKNKSLLNPFVILTCIKIEKKREVKLASKKSSIRFAVSNPVWNEHFAFKVYPGELSTIAIDVKVLSKNALGMERTLGEVRLAKKSLPLVRQQWNAMTSKFGIPTAQWYNIRK